MSDLIDTTEMYLRTIYELGEEGVPPLRARIAERLKQSGPTVSQTVARMERDGLVSVHPDRHLVLSPRGEQLAARVMRRHRLAERLLTDVIGLEWHLVHEEACRWEHVISTDVERRLVAILDHPVSSPYGNPIPALEELGVDAGSRVVPRRHGTVVPAAGRRRRARRGRRAHERGRPERSRTCSPRFETPAPRRGPRCGRCRWDAISCSGRATTRSPCPGQVAEHLFVAAA